MKRRTKIGLTGAVLLLGAVFMTGCTSSFCSTADKAHMLYMFDPGSTIYTSEATRTVDEQTIENTPLTIEGVEVSNVYYYVDPTANKYMKSIKETVEKNGIRFPSNNYFLAFDKIVLSNSIIKDGTKTITSHKQITTARDPDDYNAGNYGVLDVYGYLKYSDGENELWDNWTVINNKIYIDAMNNGGATYGVKVDELPTSEFIAQYKSSMNSYINSYRSCLAIDDGYYGAYGENYLPTFIEGKKWTQWNGLLEFLFVWPIGAFVDVLTSGMLNGGVASGVAQLLAIVIVTFVVRTVMFLLSFRSTKANAKMQELQPELAKIQAKYPNANTNNYERQRLAQETQRLYKKNGINPLGTILIMVLQFPIFICVWGALQGSAWLSTGSILGLRLSDSISSVLFSSTGWQTGGAVTALFLFLLMAAAQTVAMLLPQWIQKKKMKDVQKLGRNPAQQQNMNRTKWFTYIMLAMIIFMGFSLVSAMGVYWFVGALFSIVQTLVMTKLNNRNKGAKK